MKKEKPKIVSDEFIRGRITRQLEIELPDGQTIFVDKWATWDETEGDDNDYDFYSSEDRKIFDTLDEETQDEVKDIINEYKLKI